MKILSLLVNSIEYLPSRICNRKLLQERYQQILDENYTREHLISCLPIDRTQGKN